MSDESTERREVLPRTLRAATEKECRAPWGGFPEGRHFRCYLCGHRFAVGDLWRFVYNGAGSSCPGTNFLVCASCDGPDVMDRRRVWMEKYGWMLEERP